MKLEWLHKRPYLLLLAYCIITLAAYAITHKAGYFFDFNGWAMTYEQGTFKEALNCFGYEGLHQVEQISLFSLYKIFGWNTWGWYAVFAVLHSLVAYSVYHLISLFLHTIKVKKYHSIAIFASLLFLLSPLAADTVVNKVSIHYMTSALMLNLALIYGIKYTVLGKWQYLVYLSLAYAIALFSLEISYVFPVLSLIAVSTICYVHRVRIFRWEAILVYSLPFVLLGFFLLLHQLVIGKVIGHYGADVHMQFDLTQIATTTINYFSAYLVHFEHWHYPHKQLVITFLNNNMRYSLPLLVFVYAAILLWAAIKRNLKVLAFMVLVLLAVICLAPVANLYYAYMFPTENDRYGYLFSIYLYGALVMGVYLFPWRVIRLGLLLIILSGNTYYLAKNIKQFYYSGELAWGMLEDFKWYDEDVLILNGADNFGGVKLFGVAGGNSSFAESLWLYSGIDRREHIHEVYQMNFTDLKDGVTVTYTPCEPIKVEMAQWGTWFWKNMRGATNYETEWGKMEVQKNEYEYLSYTLYLDETINNYKLIYWLDGSWQELELINN